MMEDLIAYFLMVAIPLALFFGVRAVVKRQLRKQEEAHKKAWEEIDRQAKAARERERIRREAEAKSDVTGKTVYDPITHTHRTTVTNKKTGQTSYMNTPVERSTSTANSAPASSWSSDPLTTMIIADMLLNNKDTVAGTVKWKDDTPTITETYSKSSYSSDDDNSRKSSSSSFSSSDSSSSWDSSSSSSDSGPSSDW